MPRSQALCIRPRAYWWVNVGPQDRWPVWPVAGYMWKRPHFFARFKWTALFIAIGSVSDQILPVLCNDCNGDQQFENKSSAPFEQILVSGKLAHPGVIPPQVPHHRRSVECALTVWKMCKVKSLAWEVFERIASSSYVGILRAFFQWLPENSQENPIFHGKIHGFL
jgi:hypothetical protein